MGFLWSQDLKETGLEIGPAALPPRSRTGTIEGRPCAQVKGNKVDERRARRATHSFLVRGSLNIIAPVLLASIVTMEGKARRTRY